MEQANTTKAKFWSGGAREYHDRDKKNKKGAGFFAFLNYLFPFLKPSEIDKRLFIKGTKSKVK